MIETGIVFAILLGFGLMAHYRIEQESAALAFHNAGFRYHDERDEPFCRDWRADEELFKRLRR